MTRAIGRKHVRLCAFAAKAAKGIGGQTLHSLFHIRPENYAPLQGQVVRSLQKDMEETLLIVIDEFSQLDALLLKRIDSRCRQANPKFSTYPFGGYPVVLAGDCAQITCPVGDPLWVKCTKKSATKAQRLDGYALYRDIKFVVNLKGSSRLDNSTRHYEAFKEILQQMNEDGCLKEAQAQFLLEHCNPVTLLGTLGESTFNERFGNSETQEYHQRNDGRQENNYKHVSKMVKNKPQENIVFQVKRKKIGTGQVESDIIENNFMACVNARVAYTTNLNTHIGILNGAMGTIKDFVWNPGEHPENDLPKAIVVEFDDYTGPPFFTEPERRRWVPLTPRVSEAMSKNKMTRYQGVALTLASSFTCHKAQGITNKVGAIVDLGSVEICAGTTYVALSRTMALERLCIVGNPSTSRLTTPHADVHARKGEQKRLRKCAQDYEREFPVILF